MDLGFEQAGWELKWAIEWDKSACETHRHNRKDKDYLLIHGDVREVQPEQLSEVDCIIGGPPCQGFSTANSKRAHANGNISAWKDDPRNLLYKEYLRLVTALRPKYFVMENVKAMFTTGAEATGEPGPIMREVLRDFTEAGYRVAAEVLNAVWYGVPQFRERTIVIGARSDLAVSIRYPVQTHGEPGSGYLLWKTVRDAIGDLPEPVGNVWRDTGERRAEKRVSHDQPAKLIQAEERPGRSFRFGNHEGACPVTRNGYELGDRDMNPDAPSPALNLGRTDHAPPHPGPMNHEPAPTPAADKPQLRRLTPRECARLQSVPDWYFFCGSKSATYRQIGNGVPVLMAQRIAEVLLAGEGGRTVAPYQPQLTIDDLLGA